ncbi:MAG: CoA pyrophosphatase [Verrucomicrobia bacterium]|nr:CoA pyrophosphatase [Verrucomicrobiota bacterium]MBV8484774.1 CoA pyrophosphatase [Verrucomicrobiota bacterium]
MPSYTTTGVLEAVRGHCPRPVLTEGLRPAAVIVPIQDIAGEHYLTLIERSATLNSHAGEIAFPGGNITDDDQDALEAALRELEEEIGISRETVGIVGQLDQVVVASRYLLTPFVGTLASPLNLRPNAEEVRAVLSVPVSALFERDCFTAVPRTDGRPGFIYHFRYGTFDIWGATARILKQLFEIGYAQRY